MEPLCKCKSKMIDQRVARGIKLIKQLKKPQKSVSLIIKNAEKMVWFESCYMHQRIKRRENIKVLIFTNMEFFNWDVLLNKKKKQYKDKIKM